MNHRSLPTSHTCPGGCGAHVPRHRLACRSCWSRLPQALQRAIWQHHESGDRAAHAGAVSAAVDWYRANPRACPCPPPDQDGRQAVNAGCRTHGVHSTTDDDPDVRSLARLMGTTEEGR